MSILNNFICNYNSELNLKFKNVKNKNSLKIIALCCWMILIVAQIIMIIIFDGEQVSDASAYVSLAKKATENNTIYPSYLNAHSSFTFGNGYVNLLVLIFKFTDNLKAVFFINLFATQILLFSSSYILYKITNSKNTVYWFIILFSLLTTYWTETVQARTEIIFTAIAFSAIAFAYSSKKGKYIYAGVLLALANWVRPLGIAFLIGILIKFICENEKIKAYIKLFSGYFITILLIGTITYIQCGEFIYQSTTFGYNLIMSANDEADGSFMNVHTEGKVGYISPEKRAEMSFKDFDEYYVNLSLNWIKDNPIKYISQTPSKLFYLFATETYSGISFFNNKIETGGIDYINSLVNKFKGNEEIYIGDILIIFTQLWYMFIVALFFFSFLILLKRKFIIRFLPLLFILLCGTGITLLIVGGARYHFPYLPIFIMGASIILQLLTAKKKS